MKILQKQGPISKLGRRYHALAGKLLIYWATCYFTAEEPANIRETDAIARHSRASFFIHSTQWIRVSSIDQSKEQHEAS
jgi:hypothetical protein